MNLVQQMAMFTAASVATRTAVDVFNKRVDEKQRHNIEYKTVVKKYKLIVSTKKDRDGNILSQQKILRLCPDDSANYDFVRETVEKYDNGQLVDTKHTDRFVRR